MVQLSYKSDNLFGHSKYKGFQSKLNSDRNLRDLTERSALQSILDLPGWIGLAELYLITTLFAQHHGYQISASITEAT